MRISLPIKLKLIESNGDYSIENSRDGILDPEVDFCLGPLESKDYQFEINCNKNFNQTLYNYL